MQIPRRVPGLNWLILLWGVAAVVWTILEGDLRRVILFGFLTTLTGLAYLIQRFAAGKQLSITRGLLFTALFGAALGAGTAIMTLFLMAVKTGLHAHGPEFTSNELVQVWQWAPLCGLAGLLAGLGLGLLLAANPGSD